MVWASGLLLSMAAPVFGCGGTHHIRLAQAVQIDAALKAEIQAMPPLKVLSVEAPPLSRYHEGRQAYEGVALDVFCFIAGQLGIGFEIDLARDTTMVEKLRRVHEGRADVFIPLSHSEERARRGLFTKPYYTSHYAVIARHGSEAVVRHINDLAGYQVGYLQGVVFGPLLQSLVPAAQLHAFSATTTESLFKAVQNGSIDLAVYNKNMFVKDRYSQELFDLEVIHTLYDHPRHYRFYFSQTPGHQRLVEAFELYLAAVDVSASIRAHDDSERDLLEYYMAQRQQQTLLLFAGVAAALLALLAIVALWRHRRFARQLTQQNAFIEQQREALYQANQQLDRLNRTDKLTGIFNRRHFDEVIASEYKRYQRTGSPLSLLIIDADYFKRVNDGYGHARGDDYLCAIARVMESNAGRSGDTVARYGGEEFACLLTNTSGEQALAVAERIGRDIAGLRLPNTSASPPWLTVSIGIATLVEGDPGLSTLFEQADAQLYEAKQLGRNRCRATVLGG